MIPIRTRAREALTRVRRLPALPRLIGDLARGRNGQPPVVYLVEAANWSIRWDGLHITRNLPRYGWQAGIDTHPSYYANRLLHFGSLNTFQNAGPGVPGGCNRLVVTVFHGDFGIEPNLDRALQRVLDCEPHLDRIVVSAAIMEERFRRWGVPAAKLCRIPLGVDRQRFRPATADERDGLRQALGVPGNRLVIGSFQKDGRGWGEGREPKLIKGPDVFVAAVRRIARERPVHVLLSGPARGYVKAGLDAAGIPWTHRQFDNPGDVAALYRACDLYIVASREEGGPKALLEAMACGVPLVSTRVGMAADVIEDGVTGRLVNVEDVGGIVEASLDLTDAGTAHRQRAAALKAVTDFDWSAVAGQYAALYTSINGAPAPRLAAGS